MHLCKTNGRETLSRSHNDLNTTDDSTGLQNVHTGISIFVFEISFAFLNLFLFYHTWSKPQVIKPTNRVSLLYNSPM
jgi:hypothetical protein